MSNSPRLQRILYHHCLRSALVPMLLVECLLLALFFGITLYISDKNQALLLDEVRRNLLEVTATETAGIDMRLAEIARLSRLLQADHQRFFANSETCVLPVGEPSLEPHPNGAFYKTADNGGASLYYSASTIIGAAERRQARCSEAIDPLLRAIVETHPLVTQA